MCTFQHRWFKASEKVQSTATSNTRGAIVQKYLLFWVQMGKRPSGTRVATLFALYNYQITSSVLNMSRSNTYRWYKRRICSCVNLLYGNETVGRLKFGYKSKWEGISTSFKRSHHLWPPKGAHGGSVLPKLTVGTHKTLILCTNMSNKCIK
jgi:hypothetical protein